MKCEKRNSGYATEMLKQIKDIARAAGLEKIQLSVEKNNNPSVKTIIKTVEHIKSFTFQGEEADIYLIEL